MKEFDGAIGIDLGTTYSCAAVWSNNEIKIVSNEIGRHTTPSCVAFTENGCIVGEAAKTRIVRDEQNTIYDVKRFIGRKFTDPHVQNDMKRWPFKVIDRGNNTPVVQVKIGGETKTYTAEEISSKELQNMKEAAEKYLGESVTKAVITVPAYFNNAQREATKKAAEFAGFEVLRIINEPTAAAIAYGMDKKSQEGERNVLIFDFGGGTFDVTLLTVENGEYAVKATDGDTHLGGEDIDNCLVNYFKSEFLENHPSADFQKNKRSLRRLRTACEQVKRELSSTEKSELFIDSFYNGEDYEQKISRAEFEELCEHLFQSTIPVVKHVLQAAKMDKRDVDDVVLVGGSTRIPKVKSILSHFFDGKDLKQIINPDEAVAYGAALLAHEIYSEGKNIVLNDVLSQTLGTDIGNGRVKHMIKRNTPVPVSKVQKFKTITNNQTSVTIKVLEGDSDLIKECNLLGEFLLEGITPASTGVVTIEVTYKVDQNGCLSLTAQSKNTENVKRITIHEKKN